MAKKTKKQIKKKQSFKVLKIVLFVLYHDVLPVIAILGLICFVAYCSFGV
jgi:hypothetical protein